MQISENMSVMEKLRILTDAAKYDVACTSSGTSRGNDGTGLGSCVQMGICHSFAADGRCISLCLRSFLPVNENVFLIVSIVSNRRSNDVPRAIFYSG